MVTILIIDDDLQLCKSFSKILEQEGYSVQTATSGEEGLQAVRDCRPSVVVLDYRLPQMNGIEAFQAIHAEHPKLPVIICTAFGGMETAIEAIKMGAFDYITKPFEVPDMLATLAKAVEASRFMASPVDVSPDHHLDGHEAIIGRSPAMFEVYKAIGKVSGTDATVLIRGESGTGKELAARAIYQHSQRFGRPFLVINCVAIPETLLESELFGYEKGAFTGAVHRKPGKIEQANKGTVFLDEIGDMPMSIQSKLLRLLQERSMERLGGRDVVPIDVRILAATSRNLEEAVKAGRFREDLYYRLKVVTVTMPPLRERLQDIPLLAEYFLCRYAQEMQISNPGITAQALETLQSSTWPGNIRELSNVLQKTLIFNQGAPIQPEAVLLPGMNEDPEAVKGADPEQVRTWIRSLFSASNGGKLYDSCLDAFSSLVITEALNVTNGNRSQAARLLGLSRPTLHSKIDKLGIEIKSQAV